MNIQVLMCISLFSCFFAKNVVNWLNWLIFFSEVQQSIILFLSFLRLNILARPNSVKKWPKIPNLLFEIFWLYLTFIWTLRVHFVENSNIYNILQLFIWKHRVLTKIQIQYMKQSILWHFFWNLYLVKKILHQIFFNVILN